MVLFLGQTNPKSGSTIPDPDSLETQLSQWDSHLLNGQSGSCRTVLPGQFWPGSFKSILVLHLKKTDTLEDYN